MGISIRTDFEFCDPPCDLEKVFSQGYPTRRLRGLRLARALLTDAPRFSSWECRSLRNDAIILRVSLFLARSFALVCVSHRCSSKYQDYSDLLFDLVIAGSQQVQLEIFRTRLRGILGIRVAKSDFFPDLTKQFISYSIEIIDNEQGLINPSSLAFIYETLSGSLTHLGLIPSSILVNVIYVAAGIWIFWTIWISWTSWRAWRLVKITDEGNNFNRSFLILFSILVYTLVMPRMKDYAYMIAIPSVLFAIERFEISVPRWILFLPLILLSSGGARPALFQVLWDYYPLFVASVFWYLYLRELEKQSVQPRQFTRESSFELGVEPAPRT